MTKQQVEVNVNMNTVKNGSVRRSSLLKSDSTNVRVIRHNLNLLNSLVKLKKKSAVNDLIDMMLIDMVSSLSHSEYLKLELLMELLDDKVEG